MQVDLLFEVVPSYLVGSPIRSAIISSYSHVEILLCVTSLCLCTPTIVCAVPGYVMQQTSPSVNIQQGGSEFRGPTVVSRGMVVQGNYAGGHCMTVAAPGRVSATVERVADGAALVSSTICPKRMSIRSQRVRGSAD